MARKLSVVYSARALRDLNHILLYNLEKQGEIQAIKYIAFLEGRIASLASNYDRGKIVQSAPSYRYLLVKRHRKGDGHIAVYQVTTQVEVLRIFHTKQDWENYVSD